MSKNFKVKYKVNDSLFYFSNYPELLEIIEGKLSFHQTMTGHQSPETCHFLSHTTAPSHRARATGVGNVTTEESPATPCHCPQQFSPGAGLLSLSSTIVSWAWEVITVVSDCLLGLEDQALSAGPELENDSEGPSSGREHTGGAGLDLE